MSGKPPTVLLRCDGGPGIGFGHFARCRALAEEFERNHGCQTRFWVERGAALLSDVALVAGPEGGEIATIIDLPFDDPAPLPDGLPGIVAAIDDGTARRLAADMNFYPPVPALDWQGYDGAVFSGWDWVVLGPAFANAPPPRKAHSRPKVLVTMGGADPRGFTSLALDALARVAGDFDVRVILGPAFDAPLPAGDYETIRTPRDMRGEMLRADLAIAAFGVTAFELAACAVPGILLCLSDDHARSACAFEEAGIGVIGALEPAALADQIARALAMPARKKPRLVDGRGAARIAREIITRAGLSP
jgi:spore coat polysaccharide biosynthesis protein SpsF